MHALRMFDGASAGSPAVTPLDRHIARRIRGKRRALDIAADVLAQALGVDADTFAGYERGTLHVPSEHLVRLGEIMEVPVSYFLPSPPRSGT